MTDQRVRELVEQAVSDRYGAWAGRHPSLASVIDRMTVVEQAAQSIRATPAYAEAVAQYHQAGGEQELLGRLLGLAETVVATILR